MKLAAMVVSVGLVACGGGKEPGLPDVDAPDTAVDADIPAGWTKLISRTWDIPAGATDTYRCRRVKVPEDMWISGFQALNPTGTHHQVLTITDGAPTQMGDYNCNAGNLDSTMLYAAGVGTEEFMFPSGVAIHLAKDSYININLHLYNASDVTVSGESGVLVKTTNAADVQKEVDFMFAGTYLLNIPADGQNHSYTGGCTVPASGWEVFSLWPHMHQIATHQKVEHMPPGGGTPEVLLDEPYSFNDQEFYPMTSKTFSQGAAIRVTCTYNNPVGGSAVGFGDSSTDEMCFAGLYKYPAGGDKFQCVGN